MAYLELKPDAEWCEKVRASSGVVHPLYGRIGPGVCDTLPGLGQFSFEALVQRAQPTGSTSQPSLRPAESTSQPRDPGPLPLVGAQARLPETPEELVQFQTKLRAIETDRAKLLANYLTLFQDVLDARERAGLEVGQARAEHERLRDQAQLAASWPPTFYEDLGAVDDLLDGAEEALKRSPAIGFLGVHAELEAYEDEIAALRDQRKAYQAVLSGMREVRIRLNGLQARAAELAHQDRLRRLEYATRIRGGLSGAAPSGPPWWLGLGAAAVAVALWRRGRPSD